MEQSTVCKDQKKVTSDNTAVKVVSCIVPWTLVSKIRKWHLEQHCRQNRLIHRPNDTRLKDQKRHREQHCRQNRLLHRPIDTRLNRTTLVKVVSCIAPLTFVSKIRKWHLEQHCRQSRLVHRLSRTTGTVSKIKKKKKTSRTTLSSKSSLASSH